VLLFVLNDFGYIRWTVWGDCDTLRLYYNSCQSAIRAATLTCIMNTWTSLAVIWNLMRFKSPVVDVAIRLCCRCNLRSISTSHVTIHALLPLVQLLNIFHITAHFVALDFIATHFHMYICSARSFVSFAVAIFAPRFQNSVVFFRKTTTNVPLCHACFCLTARNSVIINVVTKWEVVIVLRIITTMMMLTTDSATDEKQFVNCVFL